MKIEITLDGVRIREIVEKEIADKCVEQLLGENCSLSYDERERIKKEKIRGILKKIKWENASKQLNELVFQKFFEKALGV